MPEGPTILLLKEAASQFKGKKILEAAGTVLPQLPSLKNKTVIHFKTWGKQLLICFDSFTIRIHLLLFGSYAINERKKASAKLSLRFSNGELNFYACSVLLIEDALENHYDWSTDIMSAEWDAGQAIRKLKENPQLLVCDALMDQSIFSGVGNIIKNEVLFRTKINPQNKLNEISPAGIRVLVKEAVVYARLFYEWKKAGTLNEHLLAYKQKTCARDHHPIQVKILGKTKRKNYYCNFCQQ